MRPYGEFGRLLRPIFTCYFPAIPQRCGLVSSMNFSSMKGYVRRPYEHSAFSEASARRCTGVIRERRGHAPFLAACAVPAEQLARFWKLAIQGFQVSGADATPGALLRVTRPATARGPSIQMVRHRARSTCRGFGRERAEREDFMRLQGRGHSRRAELLVRGAARGDVTNPQRVWPAHPGRRWIWPRWPAHPEYWLARPGPRAWVLGWVLAV